MPPHVPGAFLCACRWVVGHASLWRTLSARWRRACVWSGVGADTRRHASFAFRGGACCFALWGGDACTFALRGGGGACIFALRSGGACCFALWGGGACSFTFRGSAGCFCFRCVKYGLRNLRAARRKTSHTASCGRGRFDGTGLRCSIRTRWRPSIRFYFRTWRRACVWGCTVSIGVWHTLPTRRNISFRYVRVSAHIIPRPGPTTVRILLFTGGKGVFGGAQGGGAFAAPSGGGGGFASYAPQAASGGFGALAQAGGSAPAPSFGGHR